MVSAGSDTGVSSACAQFRRQRFAANFANTKHTATRVHALNGCGIQVYNRHMALLRGDEKRSDTILRRLVDLCAAVEEPCRDIRVTLLTRN